MELFKLRKVKRLALESIMLSMDEIKMNFENISEPEYIKANAEAMKNLAEAFEIVKKS